MIYKAKPAIMQEACGGPSLFALPLVGKHLKSREYRCRYRLRNV